MRVLFVSLLRAGDFIMQVPLLKSQGTKSEVHVLVNDEFSQLKELYPEFHFHFFPRKYLQSVINDQKSSLLMPFEALKNTTAELNQLGFTKIYNLTHNRISGFLMDQLQANEKHGLVFSNDNFVPFKNSWHSFFNSTFSENKRSAHHYLTALAKSVDLAIPQVNVVEDRSQKKSIYFQIFTSDTKKNWNINQWQELYDRVSRARPDVQVQILASPSEATTLSAYFPTDQILVCNLSEAREKLKSSALLVTGDTSLAHLAAETKTPVLVLSLGSSDFTKTMPWLQGAWVLSSEVPCAPCTHSSACSQAQHLCGQSLKVATVLSVMTGILTNKYMFSIASPERLVRMEYQFKSGLRPVSASLTRREVGNIEQNPDLF